MSAKLQRVVYEDVWQGLYGESWKGLIADESFAHPAKFSRALIRRIYDHVIEEGWANKGSSVVDPFGGVALGAFDAMRHGLNWYGCELEAKFVGLGNQNIALWNERFSRMPNWGTARLLQGDSRKLVHVLSAADCCVSSPPYVESLKPETEEQTAAKQLRIAQSKSRYDGRKLEAQSPGKAGLGGGYGSSEGQLGAMNEGDLNLAISSPPYSESMNRAGGIDADKSEHTYGPHSQMNRSDTRYGTTVGQLGAMPEGQLCVSSPPFPQPYTGGGGINVKGYGDGSDKVGSRTYQSKGGDRTEGNLETLDATGFDVAVSSPPYEGSISDAREGDSHRERKAKRLADGEFKFSRPDIFTSQKNIGAKAMWGGKYSMDPENVGNQRGETFWSASRLILEQLHQVIIPGGHAVFVVKAFVRDKKIVDFPGQWAQLCEAVGFRLLHHHRASLVEHSGTQGGFDEDKEIRVERKSFFRRLAEAKGSPRIDHESVLCFERA